MDVSINSSGVSDPPFKPRKRTTSSFHGPWLSKVTKLHEPSNTARLYGRFVARREDHQRQQVGKGLLIRERCSRRRSTFLIKTAESQSHFKESNMTMSEQLQERVGKPHLSYSSLKYALGDMKLWEMYMRGNSRKSQKHFSSALSTTCCCLNQRNSNDLYHALDDTHIVDEIGGRNPRATKKYKNGRQNKRRRHRQSNWLVTEDVKKAKEMIQRLKDCGLYDKRFAGGKYQVEFNVDLDGVPLKGFLDCLQDGLHRGLQVFSLDRASSGTTSIASATTSKPMCTPRSLTSRISIGSCRRRLTRSTLPT